MLRWHRNRIDWLKIAIVAAIGLCCLWSPLAIAQNAQGMTERGIAPNAMQMYLQAARELHQGNDVAAEKDANRAIQMDGKFADAEALAATAALAQKQFDRARTEAADAVRIDAADEKAWVILATADNYLAQYAEAIDALGHVGRQDRTTWQAAYQWARAEAGENDASQTLEWANRAALAAPSSFAPLHLLRASALLAADQNAAAADELETYLQLLGKNAPQREQLTRELHRLRRSADRDASSPAASGDGAAFNALAN